MFLSSKNILSYIFFCLVVFSCSEKKGNPTLSFKPDSLWLSDQSGHYYSLYKLFRKTNNPAFLKQAGVFADSVLHMPGIPLDSFSQKKYFSTLFNRALDLNDLNYFVRSYELLELYIRTYKPYDFKEQETVAYAQKTLANICIRYGDHKKAALLFNQSLKYYAAVKKEEEIASCYINIAIRSKELQQYAEAEDTLQKVLHLPKIIAKRKAIANIELADVYIKQYKMPDAGLHIQEAKQLLSDLPDNADITETYRMLFNIEGNFLIAANDPLKALQAYRQAVDSARKVSAQDYRNREVGKIYIAIGQALEELNRPDSALIFYNKALYTVVDIDTNNIYALPQPKDIYAENTIAEALYARADCIIKYQMKNDSALANAVNCYRLAFAAENKLLNAFSYDESRLFMVEATRKQTEKAIGICYHLYKKTNDVRWTNEAFLFAEHNKSFVLQESVRRNIAATLFFKKDSLYQRMQELQSNLALTTIELSKQNFSAVKDTALLHSLTATKQKDEEALLAAENDLRIKNPQYTNWLNEETTLSATELIDKTIANGTGMVEYFSGDSSLYAFSASKSKAINFYKLDTAAKTMATDLLQFFSRQDIILNNPVQYANTAYHLYQSLLEPYLPNGNNTILIIPDGFIGYIPFDALLTNSTSSNNISSFPFLIKQQQTYYAFSCKTLLVQSQNNNNTATNSITAFAPVFANRERNLSSLMHSNEELEAIKAYYPQGKFFTGSSAGFKQFEDNCSNSSILHFATHASPGNDSLPARIELFDSSVYINLIYAKKINAKLVVLSGCKTGTGILNRSEGLMSLARGFSYAGTKNVIASLWQTEDNSSARIFNNFYSNLSNNNFSAALHHSKLALLNNGSVATASPYYWAGYIYIGSPEESLPAPARGNSKLIAAATSFMIIIAYFIFRSRRRKKLIG